MTDLVAVNQTILNLKQQIEDGEANDWEESTREERYLYDDIAILLDHISSLEKAYNEHPECVIDCDRCERYMEG